MRMNDVIFALSLVCWNWKFHSSPSLFLPSTANYCSSVLHHYSFCFPLGNISLGKTSHMITLNIQYCFEKMELRTTHWHYLANRISLLALKSQTHAGIVASFILPCRFFLKFNLLKKNFPKIVAPQEFPINFDRTNFDRNFSNEQRFSKFSKYYS